MQKYTKMLNSKVSRIFNSIKRSYYGNTRIGNREVVGHGCNGSLVYNDNAHFPFPAIRFKENNSAVQACRVKEKGSWKELTYEEKKNLYRISFCQTFAEFQHPTGQWKFCVGWALFVVAGGLFCMIIFNFYISEPRPLSCTPERRSSQLSRMLDLHVNPIDGLSSKWNYCTGDWET